MLQAGSNKRVNNFGHDIKDSEAYANLIHQIAPKESGLHKNTLDKSDLSLRSLLPSAFLWTLHSLGRSGG